MKTTSFAFKALRPFLTKICSVIFGGLCMFSCQNLQKGPLFSTFSIPQQALITSLDTLNKDTLLVGTNIGNLYFYCPGTNNTPVDTINVGNRPIYCAYRYNSDLFVGMSNEGLKLFSKDGTKKLQYIHPKKGKEYAVYQVLKCGNQLYCATSNGLARLNLSKMAEDTTLQLLYPDSTVDLPDCKIERLSLMGNTLEVLSNDSILSFDIQGDFKRPNQPRPNLLKGTSWKDTLSIGNVTYKFRQNDTKFYAYAPKTNNPHNFVFVSAQKEVIAIADDDGDTKDVYIGDCKSVKWDRAWSRCLSRNVHGQITDFIMFPNKNCLILTSDEIAYYGDKHRVERLETNKPNGMPNRVKRVFYSTDFNKLYLALGAGFVYYTLDDLGNPNLNSCFRDRKDTTGNSMAFRCFAEMKDTIYLGTLDDGIQRMDKKGNWLKPFDYKDVRDLKIAAQYGDDPNYYILTGDSIFVISGKSNMKGVQNARIHRLFLRPESVLGVSSGHIYNLVHKDTVTEMVCFNLNPAYGYVNPYAVFHSNTDSLYIGTDKGIFVTNGDLSNLKPIDVRESFWKTHNPLPFILTGVVVLVLTTGFLLYRFMKQRHLTELKNLEEERESFKTVLRDYFLTRYQKLDSYSLANDQNSKDWVIKNASKFKDEYSTIVNEVNKTTFTETCLIEKKQVEIEQRMLKYAFAAELYHLRDELRDKNLTDTATVKDTFDKVKGLRTRYLDEIVSYEADQNQQKKDVHLHFWIIAMLSEGEKTNKQSNFINNDEFLREYIQLTEYGILAQKDKTQNNKKKGPEKPTGLRYDIRGDISSNHKLFRAKNENVSALFEDIVNFLKEENRIGVKDEYQEARKKKEALDILKTNLINYTKNIPEGKDWEDVINNIAIQRGDKRDGKAFVFDGNFHEDVLPNIKQLKNGVKLDLKNSGLEISGFEDFIKTLINKGTVNIIHDKLVEIRGFIENHRDDEQLYRHERLVENLSKFYECDMKPLFECPESEEQKHDLEGALLVWTWGLAFYKYKHFFREEYLQTFLQKMQISNGMNEGNDDKGELERWLKTLANHTEKNSSVIIPKRQYEKLVNEEDWKSALLSVLALFQDSNT